MNDDQAAVPMLRGERIWLRPLERRDLDAYRRGCTDGETGALAGYAYPASEARIEAWFDRIKEGYGNDGFWFTVCELGDDAFAGTAWLKGLDLMNGSAEFSIFISNKAWWGKGYGTDTLNTVVDFGFGQLPLERLLDQRRARRDDRRGPRRSRGLSSLLGWVTGSVAC